jgi:hypothetical protein
LHHNQKHKTMTTHQLPFKGIIINVTGTYYAPSSFSFDEMPTTSEFEIEKITACELDLTEVFEEHINEIENLTIETHYN